MVETVSFGKREGITTPTPGSTPIAAGDIFVVRPLSSPTRICPFEATLSWADAVTAIAAHMRRAVVFFMIVDFSVVFVCVCLFLRSQNYVSRIRDFLRAEADAVFAGQREKRVDKRLLVSIRAHTHVSAVVDLIQYEIRCLS